MKRMRIVFLLMAFLVGTPVLLRGDIVYPARLDILEIEPGLFRISFTLPILEGRKLKARPVLPELCEDIAEHQIEGSPSTYQETWQVRCTLAQLYGQPILIEGLIGTQTDIILNIETLSGRSYSSIIKPAKSVYVMPPPAGWLSLSSHALVSGARHILRRPEILLFLFLLLLTKRNPQAPGSPLPGLPAKASAMMERLPTFLILFVGAFAAGQFLALNLWLKLSAYLPPILTALLAIPPALHLMQHPDNPSLLWRVFWPMALLIGLIYGGSLATGAPDGLSFGEQRLFFIASHFGIAAGLVLGYWLFFEFREVLQLFFWRNNPVKGRYLVGKLTAIFGIGLFLYFSSIFFFFGSILPEIPPELFLVAAVLGLWFARVNYPVPPAAVVAALLLLGIGGGLGLSGVALPWATLVVLAALIFFGLSLAFGKTAPPAISGGIAALAIIFSSNLAGFFLKENLSLPVANGVGIAILAVFLAYSLFRFGRSTGSSRPAEMLIRVSGGVIALAAVFFRVREYGDWINTTLVTDYAMGWIRLPILSLVLFFLALLVWPRRRRIQEHLDIKTRQPVIHFVLLGMSFLLLPIGTVRISNPFFQAQAPRNDQAQRILEQVLSQTYEAFNLDDEDQLYNQLSKSVSEGLIADLYLDSRRRLSAGVQQGAEVTVKEVRVISVGDEVTGASADEGFSYDCKWMVTARVKHLQHVHHRRNIYTGNLRIKVKDQQWKIDRVALTSEDRIIIPGKTG